MHAGGDDRQRPYEAFWFISVVIVVNSFLFCVLCALLSNSNKSLIVMKIGDENIILWLLAVQVTPLRRALVCSF